jgi:WD40 repeat protein
MFLTKTSKVSRDANFSVAWNHTSEKFAVSSQDGSVHVWDIRNRNPLAKFSGLNVSDEEIKCDPFLTIVLV